MADDHTEAVTVAEPAFRSAKRRKILRKKTVDPNDGNDEDTPAQQDNAPTVVVQRRSIARKHGVTISSASHGDAASQPLDTGGERALVAFVPDAVEQVTNERFMKPAGRAGVVEDKHMVAYVDTKLAELRSAQIADQQSEHILDDHHQAGSAGEHIQPRTATNRAKVGEVEEVDLSKRAAMTGNTGLYKRQGTSTRRRRQAPTRDESDVVRDALIDEIMRESQVPLYDQPVVSQRHPAEDEEGSIDNDTAAAEAFKAEYMAQLGSNNRRRAPPPPPGGKAKGAAAVSSGPKLGGSRAQREKMKALAEANKGSSRK